MRRGRQACPGADSPAAACIASARGAWRAAPAPAPRAAPQSPCPAGCRLARGRRCRGRRRRRAAAPAQPPAPSPAPAPCAACLQGRPAGAGAAQRRLREWVMCGWGMGCMGAQRQWAAAALDGKGRRGEGAGITCGCHTAGGTAPAGQPHHSRSHKAARTLAVTTQQVSSAAACPLVVAIQPQLGAAGSPLIHSSAAHTRVLTRPPSQPLSCCTHAHSPAGHHARTWC